MIEVLGWFLALLLVVATVVTHYEVMLVISDRVLPWAMRRLHNRRVSLLMITCLLLGHIVEIWIFAFAMMIVAQFPMLGALGGAFENNLNDFVYFSAVNYTSLGYGDILPQGALRAIAVSETLTGLLMIAWSASFTYLKMEQIWNARKRGSGNSGTK